MKSRHRYGLVILGIVAFLALSPFIVVYVAGLKYDQTNHRFVKTGTVVAKTLPRNAEVYLNGKLTDTTPATIRFVNPGDYNISIRKEGYFNWDKRLNVRAQYVTYANKDLSNLVLFYAKPQSNLILNSVQNFYAGDRRIIYLTPNKIFLADIDSPTQTSQLATNYTFTKTVEITAAPDENIYLLKDQTSAFVFDARENKLYDISGLIGNDTSILYNLNFQFSDNDVLYMLEDHDLYSVNWKSQSKDLITGDVVTGFYAKGSSLYYVSAPTVVPAVIPLPKEFQPELVQMQLPSKKQTILLQGLPQFLNIKLFLTSQNEIFILGDGTIYSVTDKLNRIADYIQDVKIYDRARKLLIATDNEIDLYDLSSGVLSNVTRSSQPIKNTIAFPDLGWVFFANDHRLQNIELDTRDHQNNYTFAQLGDDAKFYPDSSAENLFVLNMGVLTEINIR